MVKGQDGKNSSTNYAIGTKNDKHLKRQQALKRRLGDNFYLRPKEAKIELPEKEDLAPYKDNNIGKEPGE